MTGSGRVRSGSDGWKQSPTDVRLRLEKSSETLSAFIKYQPAKSLIILKPPLWGCQPHTSR